MSHHKEPELSDGQVYFCLTMLAATGVGFLLNSFFDWDWGIWLIMGPLFLIAFVAIVLRNSGDD